MIGRFFAAVDGILGLVPPLLWALALAAVGFLWWGAASDRDAAVRERDAARTALHTLEGEFIQQKAEARTRLAALEALVTAQQKVMDERRLAQEKKDATNLSTIADQARRLRSLSRDAGGRGLHDPNAAPSGPGCRAGAAEGAAAAGAAAGAGDAAEAGGLLSAPLERLLLELTGEADTLNAAYQSCRADAMSVRGLAPLSVPQP